MPKTFNVGFKMAMVFIIIVAIYGAYAKYMRKSRSPYSAHAVRPVYSPSGVVVVTKEGSPIFRRGRYRSYVAVPLVRVSWEEYLDGIHTETYPATASTSSTNINTSVAIFDTVSWRIPDDQKVDRVPLAYYFYDGVLPHDWVARARSGRH